MKKLFFLLLFPQILFGQDIDLGKNIFDSITCKQQNVLSINKFKSLAGMPCNPNTFWAIDVPGNIIEYELTGNIVQNPDTILSCGWCRALAYCNNLNGGTFSPTFYTTNAGDYAHPVYFDGTSWVTDWFAHDTLYDCGGYNNNLYYNINFTTTIKKYDGTQITTFYFTPLLPNLRGAIADFAVDSSGNIWRVLTSGTNISTALAEYIVVISPSGTVIQQFTIDVPFHVFGNYGCFLLGSTFYIGSDIANQDYPQKLIPITFSGNVATVNPPVSFPYNCYDLESCNQGNPLAAQDIAANKNSFSVFPNPAKNNFSVAWNSFYSPKPLLKIYDCLGNLKMEKTITGFGKELIDVSQFKSGVYLVEMELNNNQAQTKKIILHND